MAEKTFAFTHTKNALAAVEDILSCKKCGVMMDVPVKYQMCGHLLCKPCSEGQGNTCPSCQVSSRTSEIKADNFTDSLIKAWKMIAEVVGYNSENHTRAENLPRLVGEEVNSLHVETDNELAQFGKEKEAVKESSNGANIPVDKLSSDCKQTRSKVGKAQGRQRKTMSRSRKPGGNVSTASKRGDTPQGSPSVGKKSSVSDRSSTPMSVGGSAATTPTLKKDVMKRNAKGETPLHVACIKGKIEQVKVLLQSGSNPNTKDNAGWTPLHEVSSMGAVELVELLLDAGALPSVPGPDNVTPLHDAVLNKNLEVVRVLVSHGADVNARSSTGSTPLQSTDDERILALLREPPTVVVSHDAQLLDCPPAIPGEVLVLPCGLDAAQVTQLQDFAIRLDAKLCVSHTVSFTHVIVPLNEDNVCPVTKETLTAILQAKWIVNFAWVVKSLEAEKLLPCSQFEVKGTCEFPNSSAPRKSRINLQLQRPSLFNGCHVYLVPQAGPYTVGDLELSKAELAALINTAGGVILGREPDPEAIPPSQCMIPYHGPPDSPLVQCSHYLVYQPGGRGEPRLKYNMAHIKSLPVGWLLACVQMFSLIQPGS